MLDCKIRCISAEFHSAVFYCGDILNRVREYRNVDDLDGDISTAEELQAQDPVTDNLRLLR